MVFIGVGLVSTLMGALLVPPVAAQTLTVSEVEVQEGGTATVTLELSAPVDFAIRYTYFTRDDTARALDNDYQNTSGFVYINSGDGSGSVTVRTKADTEATEADETFFVDFNSLHTLGRRPGTYSWIPEPVTGIPTSVSARVTISNVVPQTTQTSNPAPSCIPWHPGPWPPGFPCGVNR